MRVKRPRGCISLQNKLLYKHGCKIQSKKFVKCNKSEIRVFFIPLFARMSLRTRCTCSLGSHGCRLLSRATFKNEPISWLEPPRWDVVWSPLCKVAMSERCENSQTEADVYGEIWEVIRVSNRYKNGINQLLHFSWWKHTSFYNCSFLRETHVHLRTHTDTHTHTSVDKWKTSLHVSLIAVISLGTIILFQQWEQ